MEWFKRVASQLSTAPKCCGSDPEIVVTSLDVLYVLVWEVPFQKTKQMLDFRDAKIGCIKK